MKFTLTSDGQQKVNRLISRLDALSDSEKILRTAAFDSVALIRNRVEQDGQKQDGSPIGKYKTDAYRLKRQASGRQTQYIDLHFTGDLFRDFLFSSSQGGYVVGFGSRRQADKAGYLEAKFGPIFGLQVDERVFIMEGIRNRIHATIRGEII